MSKRIICADSIEWMAAAGAPYKGKCAVIAGLPDAEEIGKGVGEWRPWFANAMRLCLKMGSPCIFCVTDRMHDGHRASKAEIAFQMAAECRMPLIWHKVALRRDEGKIDIRRPGFSHMLAFGPESAGKPFPDVMPHGRAIYPNAMGVVAARAMVEFAMRHRSVIIDPFCGRGTIPACADALGAEAIGIDIDPGQCEAARALRFSLRENS